MRKLIIALLACSALSNCSLNVPDFQGTWVDAVTIPGVTITLTFESRAFCISVETYDAGQDKTVGTNTSGVINADGGAIVAAITGQTIADVELEDAELQAYLAFIGGGIYTAKYSVDGDMLNISGDLVKKITYQSALKATRKGANSS